MGKKTEIIGAVLRVSCDPFIIGEKDSSWWHSELQGLETDIRRHIDDVGHIEHELEIDETCEYCGSGWSEGDSPHNGGCCHEDILVMDAQDFPQ